MPLYIRLLGYTTANVTTTAERSGIRRVFDNVDNHTDDTLCQALQKVLREHTAVTVSCLTLLDGGTVSVFDSQAPRGLLHRVTCDRVDTTGVSFDAPPDRNFTVDRSEARGFADVECEGNMAIICAVGEDVHEDPTAFGRAISALGSIPLRMVSQAASRRNITFVLRDADAPQAMMQLHEAFFERVKS